METMTFITNGAGAISGAGMKCCRHSSHRRPTPFYLNPRPTAPIKAATFVPTAADATAAAWEERHNAQPSVPPQHATCTHIGGLCSIGQSAGLWVSAHSPRRRPGCPCRRHNTSHMTGVVTPTPPTPARRTPLSQTPPIFAARYADAHTPGCTVPRSLCPLPPLPPPPTLTRQTTLREGVRVGDFCMTGCGVLPVVGVSTGANSSCGSAYVMGKGMDEERGDGDGDEEEEDDDDEMLDVLLSTTNVWRGFVGSIVHEGLPQQ